jgi:2-polyprenyl-3-methyl-5-hydroxy-6-metoxy-1,4-benzoquinol methylase
MDRESSPKACVICSEKLQVGIQKWHFKCHKCGYESANLEPNINEAELGAALNETSRERSLKELRSANFAVLVERLKALKPTAGSLLEVGSAHGWFLEQTSPFFSVFGVEPDNGMYVLSKAKRFNVRNGYFPDVLEKNERFDAIVFNDVLEHIPHADQAVEACARHLRPDGLLLVNLPNSSGFFYRVSKLLCRLGAHSYFERMWQKDMPSPHLHYFNKKNLHQLLDSKQFRVIDSGNLEVIRAKGLFDRLSYANEHSFIKNTLLYVMILSLLPLLSLFPSDIHYVVAQKGTQQ